MKTSKVLGSLALSLALAMGVTPAFAGSVETDKWDTTTNDAGETVYIAPHANGEGTMDNDKNSAETKVKALTKSTETGDPSWGEDPALNQISATVPLWVTVALDGRTADDDGAQWQKVDCPLSLAYQLINTGVPAIEIADIEVTQTGAAAEATALPLTGLYATSATGSVYGKDGNIDPEEGTNAVELTWSAKNFKMALFDGNKASEVVNKQGTSRVFGKISISDEGAFSATGSECNATYTPIVLGGCSEVGATDGEVLPIELAGVAYINTSVDTGKAGYDLCTIKYTVAAHNA